MRRPEQSDHPAVSRKYAREWWWTGHDKRAYRCPDCGRGWGRVHGFDVHHRDSDPTNNDPENLIAVCCRCHAWRHTRATVSGLDLEEWEDAVESLGDDTPQHNAVAEVLSDD